MADPVPIGRGLRGDKSLLYPPPRCSQFRSSSLSMHLQGWNPNWGFRYLGLPPFSLHPSCLHQCQAARQCAHQSKFHRHTLSNRQRLPQWVPATRRPVPSRPKPVMPSHMAVTTRSMFLRFMCAGGVPSTSCVPAAGTEQAETSMDIDLLVTGSLWFPHDSLWSYVHMDDGDITDSLKFSRTTVVEDVLGFHCVSKEKPRLALLTVKPAAKAHHVLRG